MHEVNDLANIVHVPLCVCISLNDLRVDHKELHNHQINHVN